jgi:hypothetical protein
MSVNPNVREADSAYNIASTKPVIARYFLAHLVPEALGLEAAATAGAGLLYQLDAESLTA